MKQGHVFALVIGIIVIQFSNAMFEDMENTMSQFGQQIQGYTHALYKNLDSWTDQVINLAKEEECEFMCEYGESGAKDDRRNQIIMIY